MRRVLAFMVCILCLSPIAKATDIINECDKEIYIALAKETGGGVDGLQSPGSWSGYQSRGWFRVGPFQREKLSDEYSHLLVSVNQVIVSKQDKYSKDTLGACAHRKDGFDRKLIGHDNTGKFKVAQHPVTQCFYPKTGDQIEGLDKGYRWLPFQKYRGYARYTVSGNACNPAKNNPAKERFTWKPIGSGKDYFFSWKRHKHWVAVYPNVTGKQKEMEFFQLKETPDYVMVQEVKQKKHLRALSNQEMRRKFGDNDWRDEDPGKWVN